VQFGEETAIGLIQDWVQITVILIGTFP